MEDEEDDGLMLNLVQGEGDGKRKKSAKQRWAERHGKGKKKAPMQRPATFVGASKQLSENKQGLGVTNQDNDIGKERQGLEGTVPAVGTSKPHERSMKQPEETPKGSESAVKLPEENAQRAVKSGGLPIKGPAAWSSVSKGAAGSAGQRGTKRAQLGVENSGEQKFRKVDEVARVRADMAAQLEQVPEGGIWSTSKSPAGTAGAKSPANGAAAVKGAAERVFAAESFGDLGLASALADHIEGSLGFKSPTHIQKAAIPVLLSGQDALVKADTGTGKTLAYLAPIVHSLQNLPEKIDRAQGTFAIVLAPTRELCLQIVGVAQKLVHRFHWLVPGYVMGGENKSKEKARLRKGVTILVATPGRLLDHLEHTEAFHRDKLRFVVLDEADRLLDLGFEKDLMQIFTILDRAHSNPKGLLRHQTVLCSATLSPRLDRLVAVSLENPVRVGFEPESTPGGGEEEENGVKLRTAARGDEDDFRIPEQLKQRVVKVPCRLRLVTLATLLRWKATAHGSCKMVVFFSTCDSVEFHHSALSALHSDPYYNPNPNLDFDTDREPYIPCPIFKLHGNLPQKERSGAFFAFGKATSGVLLCTDVAARGLDFPSVSAIVQYDTPGEPEEYVHRVGRTARLGRAGEAFLFLQPIEKDYLDVLEARHVVLEELPLPELLDRIPLDRRKKGGRKNGGGAAEDVEVHPGGLALQARLERLVGGLKSARVMAVDAFRSFVRAYAAHRGHLKQIFHVRKLHLGHVARSFALREAPGLLGQSSTKQALRKAKMESSQKLARKKKRLKPAGMGE